MGQENIAVVRDLIRHHFVHLMGKGRRRSALDVGISLDHLEGREAAHFCKHLGHPLQESGLALPTASQLCLRMQ